jgi:hypothetical protein
MNTRFTFVRVAALAAGLVLGGSNALAAQPVDIAQMVRYGISELSVIDWAAEAEGARVVAEMHYGKLDDLVRRGASELARVEWTAHPEGARVLAELKYGNLDSLVRRGISELARAQWKADFLNTPVLADAGSVDLAAVGRYGITEFLRPEPQEQLASAGTKVAAR